jgi:hypothetical protein
VVRVDAFVRVVLVAAGAGIATAVLRNIGTPVVLVVPLVGAGWVVALVVSRVVPSPAALLRPSAGG